VKAALVARGIPATHLNSAGYGASVPRDTNTTSPAAPATGVSN